MIKLIDKIKHKQDYKIINKCYYNRNRYTLINNDDILKIYDKINNKIIKLNYVYNFKEV